MTTKLEVICVGKITPKSELCRGCEGYDECRVPVEIKVEPERETTDEELEMEFTANYRMIMGRGDDPLRKY
jgi:hypothetical protein